MAESQVETGRPSRTQDGWLRLRASTSLVQLVEEHAALTGTSLSAYTRAAVLAALKRDHVRMPRLAKPVA